jgi:hypothetical protein
MGPVDFIALPMRSNRWQLDWSYRASFIAGATKWSGNGKGPEKAPLRAALSGAASS